MFTPRIRKLLAAFKKSSRAGKCRPIRNFLCLEPLESRLVPTTFTWTGVGGNSNWSTAANWLGNAAPTTGGTLVFGAGKAQMTNVDDISGLSVAQIQMAGGYSISGSAITLTGAAPTLVDSLTYSTGLDSQSGTNTINDPIALGANICFTVDAGQLNLNGVISGASALAKYGAGTLVLGAGNTYTGRTFISNGTLQAGTADALPASTVLETDASSANRGTFDLAGHAQSITRLEPDGFEGGAGQVTNSGSLTTFTIHDTTGMIGGGSISILGPISLIISSTGIMFMPPGTYSGGLTMTGGVVRFLDERGLGSVPTTPTPDSLTLNGGTLLDGQTVPLSINANRGVTIGPSGGTIECLSTFTINGVITGTGELRIAVAPNSTPKTVVLGGGENVHLTGTTAGTGYLQIEAEEAVVLGATTSLNVTLGYAPNVGDSYTLIHDNGGSISGTFAGLAEGATISTGGATFKITYKGGAGNDVVLTCLTSPMTTTSTTVASSLNPSVYGQSVTFTATVTPGLPSGETPTGTVTFKDGATTLGTGTVSTTAGITTATFATGTLSAGAHTQIVAQYSGDSHFAASNSATITQTVTKAALTITANSTSKTYGATTSFAGTEFTKNGLLNSDTVTSVTLASPGAAATATVAGSPYTISASNAVGTGLSNYTISYVNGSMTVNPAALTVTAKNATKTYGTSIGLAGTQIIISGLLNGNTVTSATLTSPGTAATATVAGSPYAITPSAAQGTGLANYTIGYVNGSLTVNKAGLTITANNTSKPYGTTLTFAGTEFTSSGLLNSDTVANVALTSAGAAASATVAGSPYPITPSAAVGSGLGNYTIAYANGVLTVNPASASILTITANSSSKIYGAAVTFTGTEFTVNGLQNGDSLTSVTLTSAGSAAGASVAGSTYAIIASNAVGTGLSNYTINYVAGSLTVNPTPLTITANDKSKVYSTANPSFDAGYAGFVNGEGPSALGGALAFTTPATTVSDVDNYDITPSGLTSSNYELDFEDGTLTITRADQIISWSNPANIVYGTALSGAQLNAALSVVGPAAAGALSYSPNAGNLLAAGPNQTLTVSTAATTDYNAASLNVTINVTPAPLTVTANDASMVYGSGLPTFDISYAGFVNGEDPGDLNGALVFTTPASSTSDVGIYAITPGGLTSSNYTVGFVNGTLTITQADQTISWSNPADIVYGAPLSGTQLNATVSVIGPAAAGALTYTPAAGTVLDAGSRTLAVNAAATLDYKAASANVSIHVTPALLTIAADNQTKVYGSALPTLTGTLSGVVNGDAITASYGTTATSASAVVTGGYPISASLNDPNGRSSNYTLTITGGTLTIIPAKLTVTAAGVNRVYNGATAATVILSDNHLGGDVVIDGYTSAAFADKNAGNGKSVTVLGITISGADADNYTLQNTTDMAIANITPAGLTVRATGVNKEYDATTAAEVTLVDNHIGNDVVTDSYASATFANKNVGNGKTVTVNGISIGGADGGNYALQSSSAGTTADIVPTGLTVIASGVNKVYDATTAATVTLADNHLGGDDVTTRYTSASFADKNADTGKGVTVSGLTISGADAGNYAVNTSATTAANITPAALTVSAAGVNKSYDGATAATVTLSDNHIAGDVVTDSYTSASFADPNSGNGKPVIAIGIMIVGADAGNYTLQNTTAATTANILPVLSISGHVRQDLTGNGQTADDVGLAGIRVYLDLNNNGARDVSEPFSLSDSTGTYGFTNLSAGAYTVRQDLPGTYLRTGPVLSDTCSVAVTSGSTTPGKDFDDFLKINTDLVSDIKFFVNGDNDGIRDLRGHTDQGNLVRVQFTVAANVSNLQLSLVSYTAPSASFDPFTASQQQVFEMATGTFSTGTYTLAVTLPNSFYQVDFVAGAAIDHLGPANSNIFYTPQERLFSADNDGNQAVVANGSSLAGTVYSDLNNDGARQAGEAGIGLVQVTLSGKDNQGYKVNLTRFTEPNGSYRFDNLLPSNSSGYTITEELADAYFAGKNTLGAPVGGIVGATSFSSLVLSAGTNGQSYLFGELPKVASGQTATVDFWNGTKGQVLITSFNGGSGATALATWLATNFSNVYGSTAGANSLVGKTNADVAALFKRLDGSSSTALDAQVLATALNVYTTTTSLGGSAGLSYGFSVTVTGLSLGYVSVEKNGQAFGVANDTAMSVWNLLLAVNSAASKGQLYFSNSSLRSKACNVFTEVNDL